MQNIIGLWAHMRARSTAFLRMMLERGDVFVVHEPFSSLLDDGTVQVPDGSGGKVQVATEKELIAQLRVLARRKPVFFKDTVEHRYSYLFENSDDVADIIHTFIVRDPAQAINSIFNMKANITSAEVGYEHLYEIFNLSRLLSSRKPIVVDSAALVADPKYVIKEYCRRVGLPFRPNALTWQPGARPEWKRTQRWHEDVSNSSGFNGAIGSYRDTVDNNMLLNGFLRYHNSFYLRLLQHSFSFDAEMAHSK